MIVLAAAAMALFVALGIAERRHEFATMAALGAPLRDVGAFLWSEAALVLAPGWCSAPAWAGCWPRCWSRCSSTSSTRRRTARGALGLLAGLGAAAIAATVPYPPRPWPWAACAAYHSGETLREQ